MAQLSAHLKAEQTARNAAAMIPPGPGSATANAAVGNGKGDSDSDTYD